MLTHREFEEVISRMSNNKAAGPDGIPVEAFKYCPQVKCAMFEIINDMWTHENIPDGFIKANFVMLYKKASPNDPVNYRCIALMNDAFKTLSQIMLDRLTT